MRTITAPVITVAVPSEEPVNLVRTAEGWQEFHGTESVNDPDTWEINVRDALIEYAEEWAGNDHCPTCFVDNPTATPPAMRTHAIGWDTEIGECDECGTTTRDGYWQVPVDRDPHFVERFNR